MHHPTHFPPLPAPRHSPPPHTQTHTHLAHLAPLFRGRCSPCVEHAHRAAPQFWPHAPPCVLCHVGGQRREAGQQAAQQRVAHCGAGMEDGMKDGMRDGMKDAEKGKRTWPPLRGREVARRHARRAHAYITHAHISCMRYTGSRARSSCPHNTERPRSPVWHERRAGSPSDRMYSLHVNVRAYVFRVRHMCAYTRHKHERRAGSPSNWMYSLRVNVHA